MRADRSAEKLSHREQADDLGYHLAAYFTIRCRHTHLPGVHVGYLFVGNHAVNDAQECAPYWLSIVSDWDSSLSSLRPALIQGCLEGARSQGQPRGWPFFTGLTPYWALFEFNRGGSDGAVNGSVVRRDGTGA